MRQTYPLKRVNGMFQRKGIDHDPVKPWVWATIPLWPNPVEIVSYPIPAEGDGSDITERATIMIRTRVGDPTTIKEVPFKNVACFTPDRHHWWSRPRRYYSDDPSVFFFIDVIDPPH